LSSYRCRGWAALLLVRFCVKLLGLAYGKLLDACGAISAFLVFCITAMVALNVLLRNVFGGQVPGDVEISEYLLLLVTTFAAPWLLHKGQHVRIDLMLHHLPPYIGWLCEIFSDVIGFLVSLLMMWYSTRVLFVSAHDGTIIVKEFTIPEWWTLWPVSIMFALVAVEFVFRLFRVLSGPRRPRDESATI